MMAIGGYGKVDAAIPFLLAAFIGTVALRQAWPYLSGAVERPGVIGTGLLLAWVILALLSLNYVLDYREPVRSQAHLVSECRNSAPGRPGQPLVSFEGCELAEGAPPESRIVNTQYRGALAIAWHRTALELEPR